VTIEHTIAQRNEIVARCEALFAEKTFVIRTNRDDASLRYLLMILEHHRGIIMLAPGCRSRARTARGLCYLDCPLLGTYLVRTLKTAR
jgi:hypothetical protein